MSSNGLNIILVLITNLLFNCFQSFGASTDKKSEWIAIDYTPNYAYKSLPFHPNELLTWSEYEIFPVQHFKTHFDVKKLWLTSDYRKYKLEVVLINESCLDTLDKSQYVFLDTATYPLRLINPFIDQTPYTELPPRIILKTFNDSLFVFPYFWSDSFKIKNALPDSLFKIKTPFRCALGGCYNCAGYILNPEFKEKTQDQFVQLIYPNIPFQISDQFLDDRTLPYYYGVKDKFGLSPTNNSTIKIVYQGLLGRANLTPIAPDNYYPKRDTMTLKVGDSGNKITIEQSYVYSGHLQPQLIQIDNDEGITLSLSESHLIKNRIYKLIIEINPVEFDLEAGETIYRTARLIFEEGLHFPVVLEILP